MNPSAKPIPSDLLRHVCPGVMEGFVAARQAIEAMGPLDAITRELIMFGAFVTAGYEQAVKVHGARLLNMGLEKAALQQAAMFTFGATTTVSGASRALAWIEELTVPTAS